MPEATRDQFSRQVIEIVRSRFPLVKIARAEQSFALRINGHIASLENLYRMSLLRPEDVKHHVERWAVELLRAAEGTPDQDPSFDRVKDRILPMILLQSETQDDGAAIVAEPLIDGLQIAYAIDSDRLHSAGGFLALEHDARRSAPCCHRQSRRSQRIDQRPRRRR